MSGKWETLQPYVTLSGVFGITPTIVALGTQFRPALEQARAEDNRKSPTTAVVTRARSDATTSDRFVPKQSPPTRRKLDELQWAC